MKTITAKIISSRGLILVIILLSFAMHLRIFEKDLVGFHVWRQTQTQATINSFAEEDINILNPRRNERGNSDGIFRMEFPLSQWLTALPVRLLGNEVLISRIMNFLFGILSLFGIYYLIKFLLRSHLLALAGVWILAFTPLFYYYTLNPMPDNLALTFNIWGLFYLFKWHKNRSLKYYILMLVLMALSGLCKLPFFIVFIIPVVIILYDLFKEKGSLVKYYKEVIWLVLCIIPFGLWYVWVIPGWKGNGIVSGILDMDSAQSSQFWNFLWVNIRTNVPELLLGLPALPLFLAGVFTVSGRLKGKKGLATGLWLWSILLIGLILFEMNMIEAVHDYYFLPFIPITILLSIAGFSWLKEKAVQKRWISFVLIFLILAMPVYSFFRINPRWDRPGFNEDLLIYKEELRGAVPDSALVCVGNDRSHHIFLYYIDKKGWAFEQNWMGPKKLDSLIQLGCEYLYCDSRHVDQNSGVQALFGTKVATFGQINIFELKKPE